MTRPVCPYLLDTQTYLDRPPERLVLHGYRGWTWTVAGQAPEPWREVCRLYRDDLKENADIALHALSHFVETLGLCATCPLRMRQAGSNGICRDEALVLSLLSAVQHGDQAAIEASNASICGAASAERVAHAAGIYALTLRMLGRVLLPIPAQVIDRVCAQAHRPTAGITVH